MSFLDPFNQQVNPTVSLPVGLELSSILSSVDTVFVTHTHPDHFDDAAVDKLLPKDDLHIFCQPPPHEGQPAARIDEDWLRGLGFSSVQPVEDELQSEGIEVFR